MEIFNLTIFGNMIMIKHLKKFILENLEELPINTTFDLKFSCSTGYEWTLEYNKK